VEHGELGEGRGALQGGRRPLAERLAPLLLCLVALALRLWGLGDKPLWTDEAFTWFDYRHSLAEILGARLNVHPPLFGVLMWAWMPLAGETEFSLRLPSALLSVVAVPALWRLGLRLGGPPTALLAAACMTVTPVALAYGREARMYGIVMSQSALALLVADRLAAHPTRQRWLALATTCAAAILTHYTATATWAAAALASLGSPRASPLGVHLTPTHLWGRGGEAPSPTPQLPRWLLTNAAIAIVAALWAAILLSNRSSWQNLVWLPWTNRTRLRHMALDWLSSMAGLPTGPNGPADATLLHLAAIALVASLLATGTALAIKRRDLSLPLLALAPPLALALLESQRPGWHIRFALVGLPAALLLAAHGATSLRGRLLPASALLAASVLTAHLAGFWTEWRKPVPESWRAAAAAIRQDPVQSKVALGGVGSLASYYLQPILPTHQRPVALGRAPEEVAADLNSAVAGASVVWVVPRADALMDPSDLVGTLLSRYAVKREERDLGGLPAARIELRPGARITLGPPLRPVEASFGDAVHLAGYASERTDGSIALSLEMRIERRLPADYKLFTHLLDAGGRTIAQRDVVLLDNAYRTTSQMEPGTRLRLELAIEGAPDVLAAGRAVGIGLYEAAGAGVRLPLTPPAPEHRLVLPLE
jgi:mannosyltransferase